MSSNYFAINKRKIGVCILLSIVTLGIYQIYWEYLLVKNTKAIRKDESSCTGEMLCLIFVPFYSLFWWFTRGKIVKDEFTKQGYSAIGNEIAYLILGIFGLGIVSMAIMQNDFNSLPSESTPSESTLSESSQSIQRSATKNTANFGRNTLLYLVAMLVPKIIAIFTLPLYSHYIDPADYAIFNYTTNFSNFLAVVSALGLNTYYLLSYPKTDDKKKLNGSMFWFLGMWNAVMLSILGVGLWVLWPYLNMKFAFYPYVPIALVTHFFFVVDVIPMRTYRLRGEVHFYMIRVILKSIMQAAFGILFVVVMKKGVMGKYWSEFIHNFVFAIVFVIYMIRNSYMKIDKTILKDGLKFGLPLVPAGLLRHGHGAINSAITEKIVSLAQLGVYSMGASIAQIIQMVTSSISLAVEPEFYIHAGTPGYNDFVRKMKSIQLVVVGWFCVGCSLFIREAVVLFLGKGYHDSWPVVQVLAISYMVALISGTYTTLSTIEKKTKFLLIVNIGIIGILVGSEILFLNLFGIIGIGLANICISIFSFTVQYFYIGRKKLKNMQLTRDFIMIAAAAAIIYFSNYLQYVNIWLCIAAKVVIFAGYSALLLIVYKVKISDIKGLVFKKKKAGNN